MSKERSKRPISGTWLTNLLKEESGPTSGDSGDAYHRDVAHLLKSGVRSPETLAEAAAVLPKPRQRGFALWCLSRLEMEWVADALEAGLSDPAPTVRAEACRLLGARGSRRSVPRLTRILDDDSSVTARCAAAHALGLIGERSALRPLLGALESSFGPRLQSFAAEALGNLRFRAAGPSLLRALELGTPEVQRSAAYALGELRDERAVGALRKLVSAARRPQSRGNEVYIEATRALAAIEGHRE